MQITKSFIPPKFSSNLGPWIFVYSIWRQSHWSKTTALWRLFQLKIVS